jgi:hypothetical protein
MVSNTDFCGSGCYISGNNASNAPIKKDETSIWSNINTGRNKRIAAIALGGLFVGLGIHYGVIKLTNSFISLKERVEACLDKTDDACLSIMKTSFPELVKLYPYQSRIFANTCMDRNNEPCQFVVKHRFQKLLELDLELYADSALIFANTCIGKVNKACEDVITNGYPDLLKKVASEDYIFVKKFVVDCDASKYAPCQSAVKDAFSWLLKNSQIDPIINDVIDLANDCVDKEGDVYDFIVNSTFQELLDNPPNNLIKGISAAGFAIQCIGKKNRGSKDVVKKALPELIKLYPVAAQSFATKCIHLGDEAS